MLCRSMSSECLQCRFYCMKRIGALRLLHAVVKLIWLLI